MAAGKQRGTPFTFRPRGLSDAVDGTNAPAGAMASLSNLIVDPSMSGTFVCRPAAVRVASFGALTTPGFVSGLLIVGNTAYGTIASGRNAGHDEPFVLNLSTGVFTTVAGITAANTPTSPATSGAWTPPIIAQVGSRIIVCHPGFPGNATKFGWFDISGFTEATTGNTGSSTTITGNPSVLGVQPGMTITGPDIPANTTVVSTTQFVLTTTGVTHGTTTLDTLASTSGVAPGQAIIGAGIPIGTTVVSVGVGSVVMSQAATGSSAVSVTFSGSTIVISQNATGSHTAVPLAIAGGTLAAPLWGAGDTDRNPLPSTPLGVIQFNGRAYYACGLDGILFSDSGFPCRVSNLTAVQALTTNDGVAVTALGPLMLNSPLVTTGIVAAVIAFQGGSKMQQITGDQATGNLSMNALPVATGTNSPLSIFTCERGTGFVSPEGLRFVQFNGTVSEPVGDAGEGVTVPFITATVPSRICAAAGAHTIRITAQSSYQSAQPNSFLNGLSPPFEYWYDIGRKVWTGPMLFTAASLIQPWSNGTNNTFVITPITQTASLWQSDVTPSAGSVYSENGQPMQWEYTPAPLPDTGLLAENALIDMTLTCSMAAGTSIQLVGYDMSGQGLDLTTVSDNTVSSIWGTAIWGTAIWGGGTTPFQQRQVNWNQPLVFKQLSLVITGTSAYNVKISNLYMRYQILGYRLQVA